MRAALLFLAAAGIVSAAPMGSGDVSLHKRFPVSSNWQCGPQQGTQCQTGFCCSRYGWCGSTDAHCGTGCQTAYGKCTGSSPPSAPAPAPSAAQAGAAPAPPSSSVKISPDYTCGPGSAGKYTCPTNNCCSQFGWCGSTSAYCGTGCQQGFGSCTGSPASAPAPAPAPSTPSPSPPPAAANQAAVVPNPPPAGMKLVWADEFDYTGAPDGAKWSIYTGGVYNNEVQTYTTNSQNVRVEGGNLVLQAVNSGGRWTSGKVMTQGKMNFQYGRLDVRAKVPTGGGVWPAIWLLGSFSNSWPYQGEIDIMEYAPNMSPNSIATLHTQNRNWQYGNQFTNNKYFDPNAFHVFSMQWSQSQIIISIDGSAYLTANQNDFGYDTASWPFSQPFYFILNLAMGGQMGGSVSAQSGQQFLVDYVRYYQ